MPSTDPLDAADFNPTAHINRLFPNEESLAEVDAHVGGLQERMRELDEEVLRTVRQQTSAGSSARKDLENAKASVAELFLKVLGVGLAVGVGVGAGAGAGAGAGGGVGLGVGVGVGPLCPGLERHRLGLELRLELGLG